MQYVTKNTSAIAIAGTNVYYNNDGSVYPTTGISEIHTINYYDNYTFDIGGGSSETAYGVTPITNAKGLATGSKVRVLNVSPAKWITSVTYYDSKSRPVYVYSFNDYLGTTDKIKSKLSFTGQVDETTSIHAKTGQSSIITTVDVFSYDHTGRLVTQKNKINSEPEETIVTNTYDNLGQLTSKGVGGKSSNANRLQNVNYAYNVRGWLKQINNPTTLGADLFAFKIGYNEGVNALYNGNISLTQWKTANTDNSLKTYNYQYDALNRITAATDNTVNQDYSLQSIAYDKNGNITNLLRKGHTVANPIAGTISHFGIMDNLVYTYDSGNKLQKVLDNGNDNYGFKDGSNITIEYTYDANGNMLTDANKGISSNITYNHLNLPTSVNVGGGNISYIYDATGVKLEKKVSENGNDTYTYYAGNHVYEGSSLKFFNHPEGYVDASNGYEYVYQYKDHLGNVRLSYKEDTSVASINIDDDFDSSTDGWSDPAGTASINNTSQKLNLNLINKWDKTSKYVTITPNVPLHIEFDFENSDMVFPILYVRERINGVWEPGGDRDAIYYLQNSSHHELDLTLTGDYIQIYFEKGQSTDDGISTTCYIDNFKVTQNGLEILEENNYYPFGLKHKGYNNVVNGADHKYGFGGKEEQDELGLEWMDFHARNYDPALGRWMNTDPLEEFMSPYVYAGNDPIRFADPSGMYSTDEWMKDNGITQDDLITVYQADSSNDEGDSSNTDDSNSEEECCGEAGAERMIRQRLADKMSERNGTSSLDEYNTLMGIEGEAGKMLL